MLVYKATYQSLKLLLYKSIILWHDFGKYIILQFLYW